MNIDKETSLAYARKRQIKYGYASTRTVKKGQLATKKGRSYKEVA